MLLPHIYISL